MLERFLSGNSTLITFCYNFLEITARSIWLILLILSNPSEFSPSASVVVWWSWIVLLFLSPPVPFDNHSLTVPRGPIITGINVTFMFHYFFNSQARSTYLSFFSLSFNFTLWSTGTALLLLFTPLEFFTSVLADGFSLEFEWQQVSSSLQDSSQYSGRTQQCCRLDSLYPSANFQVLQAL